MLAKLKDIMPGMHVSISATTRKPRNNEIGGKDYYFISKGKFKSGIADNDFLEWAKLYGNYYGTYKSGVEEVVKSGDDVYLEIDVHGAYQVKNKIKDAVLIFIIPPSIEELEERLIRRSTESNEEVNKRIELAKEEMKQAAMYDYVVKNLDADQAAQEIFKIVSEANDN